MPVCSPSGAWTHGRDVKTWAEIKSQAPNWPSYSGTPQMTYPIVYLSVRYFEKVYVLERVYEVYNYSFDVCIQ